MKKGFTILEFLVVFGILAGVTLIFVALLNPAERLKERRDAQRTIDLVELKKALSLYVAVLDKPDLDTRGNCADIYTSVEGSAAVNGSGWLPVNFDLIPGGSTIKKLPVDPINDEMYFYSYKCAPNSLKFELNANMESKKYNVK